MESVNFIISIIKVQLTIIHFQVKDKFLFKIMNGELNMELQLIQ
jgi:hypothetical protein